MEIVESGFPLADLHRVPAVPLANLSPLAAGGIVLGLALLACAVMFVAFPIQRRHGRWTEDGDGDSNGRPQG